MIIKMMMIKMMMMAMMMAMMIKMVMMCFFNLPLNSYTEIKPIR